MGRIKPLFSVEILKTFFKGFLLIFWPFLTACSVAVPNVKSLLSNFNSFKLTSNEIRIQDLSGLATIEIIASCDANDTGFEYQMPTDPDTLWNAVPVTTPTGIFTSVVNECATNSRVTFKLDLSSTAPFMSMTQGSSYMIKFRDINSLGVSLTDSFIVSYSAYTLSNSRLINGQGYNTTKMGGAYSLQGRVMNIQQLPVISSSGSHTLQGRVVFQ